MFQRTQMMVSGAVGALLMSAGAAAAQSSDQASPMQLAQAQTAASGTASTSSAVATDQSSNETAVGELIVTARLRAENIQKVPENIVAIGADVLKENNVTNFWQLEGFAPSVIIPVLDEKNEAPVEIRAFPAATLVSETPSIPFDLYDMSNIQILYGPQGTLFGYTALGGAVLYTPTHPQMNTFGAGVDLTMGNLNEVNANGYVNIPLVNDHLAMRIAFEHNHTDGYTYYPGASNAQALDSIGNEGLRISLQWNPLGGRFTNYSYVQFEHQDATPNARLDTMYDPMVVGLQGPTGVTVEGVVEPAAATNATFASSCTATYLAELWPAGTTTAQCEAQHLAVLTNWAQTTIASVALTQSSHYREALPPIENGALDNPADFISMVDVANYDMVKWNGLFGGGDIYIHNIASTSWYHDYTAGGSSAGSFGYFAPQIGSYLGFQGDTGIKICSAGQDSSLFQTENTPQLTPGTNMAPTSSYCGTSLGPYDVDFTDELQIHGTLDTALGATPGVSWVIGFYNAGYPEAADTGSPANDFISYDGAYNVNEGPVASGSYPEGSWAAYLAQYLNITADAGMLWKPLTGLHLTGGIRFNENRVSVYNATVLINASPYYFYPNPTLTHSLVATKPINWSGSVDYTTHDLLIYAQAAYIVVPGFANAPLAGGAGVVPGYQPYAAAEDLTDYEGGVKWNFDYSNGVRGYLDLDVYDEDLAHVQIPFSVFNSSTATYSNFTLNPANLIKRGVELQGEVFPVPNLDIYANASYADDFYTDYYASDPAGYIKPYSIAPGAVNSPLCDPTHSAATVGAGQTAGTCIMNFSSTRAPVAPYVQANLKVKYNIDMGNAGVVVPSVNVMYTGNMLIESSGPILREEEVLGPAVLAADSQSAFALVNLRLDWKKPMGHDGIDFALWVTNLFNTTFADGVIDQLASIGYTTKNMGPPRQFGFEISDKW